MLLRGQTSLEWKKEMSRLHKILCVGQLSSNFPVSSEYSECMGGSVQMEYVSIHWNLSRRAHLMIICKKVALMQQSSFFMNSSSPFPFISWHTPFPTVVQRATESGFDLKKAAIGAIPAAIATPAFAMDSIVSSLPTETLSLEVQFGAYLAVLLGTLLPVLFLVNLYTQSEARAAGKAGGQDSE